MADDRLGNIQMYEHGIGIPDTIVRKVGTVNYTTGQIHLEQFMPYQGNLINEVSLIMTPKENDVLPLRNNILFIKPEDVFVTAIPVASVQG